jgi:hypothetical protein
VLGSYLGRGTNYPEDRRGFPQSLQAKKVKGKNVNLYTCLIISPIKHYIMKIYGEMDV